MMQLWEMDAPLRGGHDHTDTHPRDRRRDTAVAYAPGPGPVGHRGRREPVRRAQSCSGGATDSATADSTGQVAESDESDNVASFGPVIC